MPKEQSDFDRAQQCVTRGMEMAEMAIALEPENAVAWSFKANLLLEKAKLAEMEGNNDRTNEIRRESSEAQSRTDELNKKDEKPVEVPTENRPAIASTSAAISGSVLEGKATSLPKPSYPDFAKRAKAQGTVVVEILIDEQGNVTTAKALSGHPLLRAAAVEAARQSTFTPTILSGQPVKVTGTLTYQFVLPAGDSERPPAKQ